MKHKHFTALIIAIVLTGCASSPAPTPITYYLLDSPETPITNEPHSRFVAIDSVFVAEYLTIPNLVLKQTDHKINIANYHLWAEPLAPSIKRALMSDLSSGNSSIAFVDRCVNCDVISIYVDHFYPEALGDAVLSGRYMIKRADGSVDNTTFNFKQALMTDGYEAAVQEMRQLIKSLSQLIQSEL